MTPEQRAVYDKIVSGPRGRLVGPLRAALLIPDLADAWQQFGAQLRYGTTLPRKITELAILCVGRYYNSQVEWFIHAREAQSAGVEPDVVDAIHKRRVPDFAEAADRIAYEYTRQLLMHGDVDEALHDQAKRLWDATGVVELTAVVGYYAMVSMTLNAQAIPTPDGSSPLDFDTDDDGRPRLAALPEA